MVVFSIVKASLINTASFLVFPIWAPIGLVFLPILIGLHSKSGLKYRFYFVLVLLAGIVVTLGLPIWLPLALYFLPSMVALSRKTQHGTVVVICNLFLGWTVLFWGLALMWALLARGEVDMYHDGDDFYQPTNAL